MEEHMVSFPNFPKLNSNNYNSWKVDMKVLLIDRGSWEFITEDTKPPEDNAPSREKHDDQRRKDKAYTTIYQGIERQFQTLIANTLNGKEAWEILKTNFEPTSRARLAGLIDEFYDLKFNQNEETIGIFCRKVNEKKLLITDAGFDIPEILTCFQLIRKLPVEYDNLVQTIYRLDDKDFTFEGIEKQLINEEGRIKQKRKDEGLDAVINAYQTGTRKEIKNFHRENKNTNMQVRNTMNKEGRTSQSYDSKRNQQCRYCKKPGHVLEDCYTLKRKQQNHIRGNGHGDKKAFYTETTVEIRGNSDHEAQTVDIPEKPLDEWLIDSAATSHFCKEKDWFRNFKELPPTDILVGDKNAKSQVLGKGDISFYAKDRNKVVEIKLKDVLYAPNMRRNLISGSCMDIAGFHIIWKNDKMVVYTEEREYYFTVYRKEKLYILYGRPERRKDETYMSGRYTRNKISMNTMHRRLCHLNNNIINYMENKNMVRGIDKLNGDMDMCTTCQLAKATRSSFKSVSGIMSNEILERVYMDVWGPSPVTSLGGCRYSLSIIDDYSRKVFIYTMKNKSDAFTHFKQFITRVERQHNRKLKIIRTDNGKEFCNSEFDAFLRQKGIKAERTSTYTPEQNGVAERFNRTAMEGVRAMLQDSGLKESFWAEALHDFVHVKNRCAHKSLKDVTPSERWWGFKPSIGHLRIFGSLAYVHVSKERRNKLQAKADLGIIVGYALKTKGYRIWLPKTRSIVETVHVKIDENKNGVETLFGNRGLNKNCNVITIDEESTWDDDTHVEERKTTNFKEEKKGEMSDEGLRYADISEWGRVERKRKERAKEERTDIYYCPAGSNARLRSLDEIEKYCATNKIKFEPKHFSFEPEADNRNEEDKTEIHLSKWGTQDDQLDYIFQDEVYSAEIPRNFEEAQEHPEREQWVKAMQNEMKIMKDREVWTLADLTSNEKVIGNRWVYTIKTDTKDNTKTYKARLVAQGFNQKYGIDYTEIFSPVVSFSLLRFFFILLVSTLSWSHTQLDVKSAYLYGNLKEKIYMRQPKGFEVVGKEGKVCLLQKAIYGLHQSGREWNNEFENILKSLGFNKLLRCNCVYSLNNEAFLLLYVDDIVLFAKDETLIQEVVARIKSRIDIKELGDVGWAMIGTWHTRCKF